MGPSSCTHPQQPSPPSPLPTWAEVARGGQERGGAHARGQVPPSGTHSTPARPAHASPPPSHLPSSHTQFMAWLSCRRAGIPARLILETDGVAEEISFWFRPSQNGDRSAAPSQHPPRRGRTKRRRRAKRRRVNRFGQASLTPSSQVCPVATAVAPATFPEVTAPPAESRNMSPPAKFPPAKRPRTRSQEWFYPGPFHAGDKPCGG